MTEEKTFQKRLQAWSLSKFVLAGCGIGFGIILGIVIVIVLLDIVIPYLNEQCLLIGYATVCAGPAIGFGLLFSFIGFIFLVNYAVEKPEEEGV